MGSVLQLGQSALPASIQTKIECRINTGPPSPRSQTHVRLSPCMEEIWKAFLIRVWGYWLKCSRAVYQPFFSPPPPHPPFFFFIILIKLRYYLIPTCIYLVLLECKPDKEYSWSPLSCHKHLLKGGWLSSRSSMGPFAIITFSIKWKA